MAVKHIKSPANTETLQTGDLVERWNHIFEWDSHCLKASQLEAWRASGDPLCDSAIRSMYNDVSSSVGNDLLERLQSDAAHNPAGPSQELLEQVSKLPPSDLAATAEEIREGQEFFLDNSVAIMQTLLYFSLAGGFSSPRITRVLQSVSYLVPPRGRGSVESQLSKITSDMNNRSYDRLLETFQFVLDVMGCTGPPPSAVKANSGDFQVDEKTTPFLAPGGMGWKSALRVRLLHGIARRRIMDQVGNNGYSLEENGIPINQEDMAATLGSFCIAPLWCLKRLYPLPVPLVPSQPSAYMAMWRQVGFYLGVDPAILRKHFTSLHAANKFLASSIVHLTSDSAPRGDELLFPTLPILLATSNRPPFPRSFERGCALTRHVLGSSLALHLGVPPTSLRAELQMRLALLIAQIPVLFSRVYQRHGWSEKRREITREALVRATRFYMGMRSTKFRPRTERGELDASFVALETVEPDPARASKMMQEYRALILEMAGVIAALVTMFVLGCIVGLLYLCTICM